MNYESKREPFLSRHDFILRLLRHLLVATIILVIALGIGVLGYHYLAGFAWVDSFLNASMILGGMGPVGELPCDSAKIFASLYALFSGLAFISMTGIVLVPVAHRVLHAFHIDEDDDDGKKS